MGVGHLNRGRVLSETSANAFLKGTFGKRTTDDKVTPCTVEGEAADFVFMDGDDAGRPASCGTGPGVYQMLSGGALDEGDKVMTSATARVIDATGAAAGKRILGRVSRGSLATGAGQWVTIDFYPPGQQEITA